MGRGILNWSSHNDYINGNKDIIVPDRVLRFFSEKVSEAQKRCMDFVNEAIEAGRDESLYEAIDQQIVGDEEFIEEVEKKIDKPNKPLRKPSFAEILRAIEETTGVNEEEIASRSRRDKLIKARALLIGAWRETGSRLVVLQPILKRDLSVLSRLSKISESVDNRKVMKQVLRVLNAHMQA